MAIVNRKDLDKIHICFLRKEDIKDVLKIQEECELSPWTHFDYLKEIKRKDSIAKVAKFGNAQVIGFAIVRLLMEPNNLSNEQDCSNNSEVVYSSSEIYNIAVKESFQNKGIGQKLFDEILSELKEKNVLEIWLEVRKSNTKAIKFYRKNGFVKQSVRRNYYNNLLEDAYIFTLSLNYEN